MTAEAKSASRKARWMMIKEPKFAKSVSDLRDAPINDPSMG
jgi:hypothetical protein